MRSLLSVGILLASVTAGFVLGGSLLGTLLPKAWRLQIGGSSSHTV